MKIRISENIVKRFLAKALAKSGKYGDVKPEDLAPAYRHEGGDVYSGDVFDGFDLEQPDPTIEADLGLAESDAAPDGLPADGAWQFRDPLADKTRSG